MNVKTMIVGSGIVAMTLGGVVLLSPKATKSEFDLPGLNDQVQKHEVTLNNHEARIVNNEKAITEVQSSPVYVFVTPAPAKTQTAPQTVAQLTPTQAPLLVSAQAPDPAIVFVPAPKLPPITDAYLNELFHTIAPHGEMRAEKRAACLAQYSQRGETMNVAAVCSQSNLDNAESFPNY